VFWLKAPKKGKQKAPEVQALEQDDGRSLKSIGFRQVEDPIRGRCQQQLKGEVAVLPFERWLKKTMRTWVAVIRRLFKMEGTNGLWNYISRGKCRQEQILRAGVLDADGAQIIKKRKRRTCGDI